MAMTKILGKELAHGVTASGVEGVHEQSATHSSAGEIKTYKDRTGADIAVYLNDKHDEYSFEALIESSVQHEIGDIATIGGITGVITKWDVTESNEDVNKVSVSIRTFPDIESGNGGGGENA